MTDRKNYLKTLKAQKQEELEAVQTQLSQTLNKQNEVRLKRIAEDILQELEKLDKKIQEIDKREISIDYRQHLELTGKQRKKLQEALIDAFPDNMFLYISLDSTSSIRSTLQIKNEYPVTGLMPFNGDELIKIISEFP